VVNARQEISVAGVAPMVDISAQILPPYHGRKGPAI